MKNCFAPGALTLFGGSEGWEGFPEDVLLQVRMDGEEGSLSEEWEMGLLQAKGSVQGKPWWLEVAVEMPPAL